MEAQYAAMVKEKTPVLGTTSISRKVRTCQTFVLIIHCLPLSTASLMSLRAMARHLRLTPTPEVTALLSDTFKSGGPGDDADENDYD
jgi:hypothetical protein